MKSTWNFNIRIYKKNNNKVKKYYGDLCRYVTICYEKLNQTYIEAIKILKLKKVVLKKKKNCFLSWKKYDLKTEY